MTCALAMRRSSLIVLTSDMAFSKSIGSAPAALRDDEISRSFHSDRFGGGDASEECAHELVRSMGVFTIHHTTRD